MKKIGYIRVSTQDQCADRQIDGLRALCEELHVERLSAVSKSRAVYEEVIRMLEPGDMLVVWSVDRAFRSTVDAITEADALRARGIEFRVVTLNIDTTTADGRLAYTVVAAVAQHERERISERTKQGLAAARRRGKRLGRPPKLTKSQALRARRQIETGQASSAELAAEFGVHPWTVTRSIRRISEEV